MWHQWNWKLSCKTIYLYHKDLISFGMNKSVFCKFSKREETNCCPPSIIDNLRLPVFSYPVITSIQLSWDYQYSAILRLPVFSYPEITSIQLSCLCPLLFSSQKTFKLFGFPIFWLWTNMMMVIPLNWMSGFLLRNSLYSFIYKHISVSTEI